MSERDISGKSAGNLQKFAMYAALFTALSGCNTTGGNSASNGNSALPAFASPTPQISPLLAPSAQPTSTNLRSPLPILSQAPTASPSVLTVMASSTPISQSSPTATPSFSAFNTTSPGTAAPSLAPTSRPTAPPTPLPISAATPRLTPPPTPLPKATPQSTPSTSPSPVPSIPGQTSGNGRTDGLSSGSISNICYQTAPANSTSTVFSSTGNISGNTYAASAGAAWEKYTYTPQTATPAPFPTLSPSVEPTPSSYLAENIYSGSYSIPNDTSGCFIIIGSSDGSSIVQVNPEARYNAVGVGYVQPPNGYTLVPGAHGQVLSLSISNLTFGGGSGSFQLDNGQSGTISITNFATFQSPQYNAPSLSDTVERIQQRFRRP